MLDIFWEAKLLPQLRLQGLGTLKNLRLIWRMRMEDFHF